MYSRKYIRIHIYIYIYLYMCTYSQKGILAPVLDRAALPDPHFVKTRANGGHSNWSQPFTGTNSQRSLAWY